MKEWNTLGEKILSRKRGATEADLDRWLEINERFHAVMITASRNRVLSKITNELHVLTQCFAAHRGSPKLLSEELILSTLKSHSELLGHFETRDSSKAESLVRDQLRFGRDTVLNFFDESR